MPSVDAFLSEASGPGASSRQMSSLKSWKQVCSLTFRCLTDTHSILVLTTVTQLPMSHNDVLLMVHVISVFIYWSDSRVGESMVIAISL